MPTLEINNLGGPLTRKNNGDIKSGLARFSTSWGYDPYSKPGNLTWMEQPVSILTLTTGTGPIAAMKTRAESSQNFVYMIDSAITQLRRIQVNNDTGGSQNVDFDSPSVLGNLSSPDAMTTGAGMTFYGSTLKIFASGDTDVGKVNFSGAANSSVITTSSVAGAIVEFLGKLYFPVGNNIGEIDSTELTTTVTKLSPALPNSVTIKDLDITPDGNYLQLTASETAVVNRLDGQVSNLPSLNSTNSYKYLWNGIDSGISSFEKFNGLSLTASEIFGDKSYSFGYDQSGAGIFSGSKKIVSLPRNFSPHPGATFSVGNILGFANPEYDTSTTRYNACVYHYGQYDEESPDGLFRLLRQGAQVRDDVISIPACINVGNLLYVPSIYGYPNNIGVAGKMYYSTVEEDDSATNRLHKLWRFSTVPTGYASIVAGTYETQTQLFSKKVKVGEIRVYTEPLIGGNDFVVDLIGSGGSVISGGSQRFQVATGSVATGSDMVQFTPIMAPTYAVGVRITNSSVTGVANWTARKLEIDYEPAGK